MVSYKDIALQSIIALLRYSMDTPIDVTHTGPSMGIILAIGIAGYALYRNKILQKDIEITNVKYNVLCAKQETVNAKQETVIVRQECEIRLLRRDIEMLTGKNNGKQE